jgi:hypothetical protein
VFLAAALAIALLLGAVHQHYPIERWLFWRYAAYWLVIGGWNACCLMVGLGALQRLLGRTLPLLEHLVLALGLGVLIFFLGMFAVGLLGGFGPVFACAFPLLLAAAGWRGGARFVRRCARHLRFRAGRARPPRPWWAYPVAGLGLLAVGAIYFVILTPENAAYDSRWYHLRLAEHYAAEGAVRRSVEGWYQFTLPHLGSFLYSWVFQLPATTLFDRVELCAHLEFALFLWTLLAIPALVRRLIPGGRAPLAWVAIFLFPGIFLYDSSLSVAADHLAAFWAIPIFLALLRARAAWEPRTALLLAATLAGAILTKYQSMYLLPFPIAAFAARALPVRRQFRAGGAREREGRRAWLAPLAVAAAAGLLLTTPHWLKNWIWHGDPFYPFLYKHLAARPWTPDSAWYYQTVFLDQFWKATGTVAERLLRTGEALFTFAFTPHDWPTMHGRVPVFGFLFTLGLLLLPFLRGTRRVWALVAATHAGIFVWYWTHHQDRYLQILLPWMAAATAAVVVIAWRAHAATRVPLVALCAAQIIWGGDVYFFPTHSMLHRSPIPLVADLIASGHQKNYVDRLKIFGSMAEVGRRLPEGSKVLAHEMHTLTGLQRAAVSDWIGYQGGLSYRRQRTPRELYDLMKGWGVSHVLWATGQSRGYDSLAGDLKFFYFATRNPAGEATVGELSLAPLADRERYPEAFPARVLYFGCGGSYGSGLHDLERMVVPGYGGHAKAEYPAPTRALDVDDPAAMAALVEEAGFAVVEEECAGKDRWPALKGWRTVARRGKVALSIKER